MTLLKLGATQMPPLMTLISLPGKGDQVTVLAHQEVSPDKEMRGYVLCEIGPSPLVPLKPPVYIIQKNRLQLCKQKSIPPWVS